MPLRTDRHLLDVDPGGIYEIGYMGGSGVGVEVESPQIAECRIAAGDTQRTLVCRGSGD